MFPIVSPETTRGWASTKPSTGYVKSLPNVADRTLAGVRMVSDRFCAVRILSSRYVRTLVCAKQRIEADPIVKTERTTSRQDYPHATAVRCKRWWLLFSCTNIPIISLLKLRRVFVDCQPPSKPQLEKWLSSCSSSNFGANAKAPIPQGLARKFSAPAVAASFACGRWLLPGSRQLNAEGRQFIGPVN
jgi:hypothetical protein